MLRFYGNVLNPYAWIIDKSYQIAFPMTKRSMFSLIISIGFYWAKE